MDITKTKEIECECGYYLIDEEGKKWYHGGSTFNGYCFKDRKAFDSGEGIAYLPECYWDDLKEEASEVGDEFEYEEPQSYTRQDFIDIIINYLEFIKADKYFDDEGFIIWCATVLYEGVDWQHPETLVEEYFDGDNDIEEDYQYYLEHKGKKID